MASKKTKKVKWFVSVRGSYLPSSSQGWLLYIPYLAFLAFSYILAWKLNISVVVQIYLVAVQWGFALFFMTWVARRHS